MPDFAPNYTARYRWRYSSGGFTHSQTVRLVSGTDMSDVTGVATKITAFLNTLTGALFTDFTVLGAEAVGSDDDAFLPCAAPEPDAGTDSTASTIPEDYITSLCFPGRSENGGRARLFLYGTGYRKSMRAGGSIYDDFRITASEESFISDAISALSELSPSFVANDDGVIHWYPYVDVKTNDRWLRRLRRG